MQLSMRDGLGPQQLPPRFTRFADHGANSRPRVNTRPNAIAPKKQALRAVLVVATTTCCFNEKGRSRMALKELLSSGLARGAGERRSA